MVQFTKGDVAAVMEKMFEELRVVRVAGQNEYAHKDDRPFRNFEANAEQLNIRREKALWVLAQKHIDGIVAHINGHRSQREGVFGRIKDLIMYLVILRSMIEEEELGVDEMTPSVAIKHKLGPTTRESGEEASRRRGTALQADFMNHGIDPDVHSIERIRAELHNVYISFDNGITMVFKAHPGMQMVGV